jgi:uncharacterized membrane protein YgcG
MTDAPENFAGEDAVDRLLSQVPAPPAMSADLVARIVAAAAATPQASEATPRRAFGERRPGLARVRRRVWVGVIAVNLVAAAAAAAALNVVHYDLRRIAEIPALILHRPAQGRPNTPVSAPAGRIPPAVTLRKPVAEPLPAAASPNSAVVNPSVTPIGPSEPHSATSPRGASEKRTAPSSMRRTSSDGDRKAFAPHARSVSARGHTLAEHAEAARSESAVSNGAAPTRSVGEGEFEKKPPMAASEGLVHDDKSTPLAASEPKTDFAEHSAKTDAPADNVKADEKGAAGRQGLYGAGRRAGRFGGGGRFAGNGGFGGGGRFAGGGGFGARRFNGGGRFAGGGQGRFDGQANGLGAERTGAAPERPMGRGRFGRFKRQGPK